MVLRQDLLSCEALQRKKKPLQPLMTASMEGAVPRHPTAHAHAWNILSSAMLAQDVLPRQTKTLLAAAPWRSEQPLRMQRSQHEGSYTWSAFWWWTSGCSAAAMDAMWCSGADRCIMSCSPGPLQCKFRSFLRHYSKPDPVRVITT